MTKPTLEEMKIFAINFAKRHGKSPRDIVMSSGGYSQLSILNAKLLMAFIEGIEVGTALVCGKIK